jgi:histidinol-phosphate aminotransferase
MHSLVRPQVVALSDATEYAKEISALTVATQHGLQLEDVADLSLNINVFGPPAEAVRRVEARLSELYRYPDAELRDLRQRLAARHGVNPDMILMGDGLDEVLKLIAQVLIEPGDEAIIPVPTFPRYQLEIEIMGGRAVLVPLTERFELPVDAILGHVSARTKLVFVCTPNNPTGVPVSREAIGRLLQLDGERPLIVVDEALIFPTETGVMDLVADHRNLMVLRTFSKSYGLAGARVGYAVGDAELLAYMEVVRPPFNVNLLGEAAVLGALADPDFLIESRAALEGERLELISALNALPGLRVFRSETSILMFDVGGTGWSSTGVTEALAKRGVIVVDCRSYAGLEHEDYIRIAIGSRRDNRRFIEALIAVLGGAPA